MFVVMELLSIPWQVFFRKKEGQALYRDSAAQNFLGLVRSINPKKLHVVRKQSETKLGQAS